jgi:hypothetical protein
LLHLFPILLVLVLVLVVVLRSRFLRHKHGTGCFLRSRLFSSRKRLNQHSSMTEDDDDHDDDLGSRLARKIKTKIFAG